MRVRVFVGLVTAVLTRFTLIGCHGSDSIAPIPLVWSSVPSGTTGILNSVWGSSASDVWAVGYNLGHGTILHYNGTSWSAASSGAIGQIYLNSVWGSSASDVWAVGSPVFGHGTILHYNGTSWSSVLSDTTSPFFYGVGGTSPSDVWAVGYDYNLNLYGGILHYNGTSWSRFSTGATQPLHLFGVWGASPSEVWVMGDPANMHYDGNAWSRTDLTATGRRFSSVWGASPSDVWAVGHDYKSDAAAILHYNGTSWYNSSWSSVSSGTTTPLFLTGVWGTSASDVWAVGSEGTILHYNGTDWLSVSSGTTARLLGVWGSSSSNVWAVGVAGTILHGSPAK